MLRVANSNINSAKVGVLPCPSPKKVFHIYRNKRDKGARPLYSSEIEFVGPANVSSSVKVPLFGSRVQAGFPSPGDEFMEGPLDLNEYLVKHKAATFFVRVTGDSMIGAGILPGDLLIVNRSLTLIYRRVGIAVLNGEITVKRLEKEDTGFSVKG